LRFGSGIAPSDIVVQRSGNDLLFKHINGTDQVKVQNWYGSGSYQLERIEFADGTVWNGADLTTQCLVVSGTEGNDTLSGVEAYGDTLYGLGGNDTLYGYGSNDYLDGGPGDDVLDGGAGADTLIGGSGNDVLGGAPGSMDQFSTGNTYEGGLGNDTLRGTLSGDVYKFNLGDGQDVIVETAYSGINPLVNSPGYWTPSGTDILQFGSGIAPSDIVVQRSGNDLLFKHINGTDQVKVQNWYGSGYYQLERVEFTDGTVFNLFDIQLGTTANDTLTGTSADSIIIGDAENDSLNGGAGNDLINGGAGVDTMIGGLGNDSFVVDDIGDIVTEALNEGTDTVFSSIAYTLGANLENLTLTGIAAINGTGNALDNVLTGNSAANILSGGLGNDIYIIDSLDTIVENANEGIDTVKTSITYTLGVNLENLTLTGAANINGTGNALNNVLIGNSGNNILNGSTGADTMSGGLGDDTYVVDNVGDLVTEAINEGTDTVQSSVTYTLSANVENLTLTGTAAINGTGNVLNNVLTGNNVANILTGGAGNDTYIVGSGDTVIENVNEGNDTVQSSITWTLGANIENLVLTGTSSISGTGNDLNNTLTGNSGANTLNGGLGSDTMIGGAGNDTYVVDNVGDIVTENLNEGTDTVQSSITYTLGPNLENLTLTGTSAINGAGNELNNVLTGNSAANTLTGNAGNDTLNGGADADTLVGGLGNDTYVIDNPGDIVTENLNEGTDTVQSYITYTLGANVENLTLMGTAAINGTGNSLNNTLTGNSAANALAGGLGNDIYVVGTGDTVVENLNEGTDTVQSSITYTLGPNLENLTLTGSCAIDGTGNELNNTITGNSASNILTGGLGNDTLNGSTGADTLVGGLGNDTYVVDNAGDVVNETLNEGTDTVQSSITYTISENVENLTLIGTSAINGTGNTLDNVLTGNSAANVLIGNAGNDTLNGGTGADTLIGGLGNDTYVVDNTGDILTEALNEGTDTVQSSITYTLGANVENLTLTGTNAINGTGNELDNVLTGNSASNVLTGAAGNDTLNGGTGADTLIGGLGNDTYVVDNTGDVVTEALNEGTDKVQSSITYTLNANVENLTLSGTSAINGTGNTLDNVLTGNTKANTLTGGSGNDTLDGGAGNDTLKGETGNDTYLFARGYGSDTINEYDTTVGNSDKVKFNSGLNPLDLIFVNNGNNLKVQIYNASDLLTVQNQNLSNAYQVEVFEASDGRQLLSSKVSLLIQEMAGFSASTGMSWNQLIQNKPDEVQTILSHYWQPQQ
jgi:Ca2+-binding RTX toxin-like protein